MPKEKKSKSGSPSAQYILSALKDARASIKAYGEQKFCEEFKKDPAGALENITPDYLIPDFLANEEKIQDFLKTAAPGMGTPESTDKADFLKQHKEICEKVTDCAVYRAAVETLIVNRGYNVERAVQTMYIIGDLSPETLAIQERLYKAFNKNAPGTKEERKEALICFLERLGKINISGLDYMNPKAMLQNINDAMTVANIGSELVGLKAYATEEFGEDFLSDPRLKEFCGKFAPMEGLSTGINTSIEMMCSNLYPKIGLDILKHIDRDPEKTYHVKLLDGGEEANVPFDQYTQNLELLSNPDDVSARAFGSKLAFAVTDKSMLIKDFSKPFTQTLLEFYASPDADKYSTLKYSNIPQSIEKAPAGAAAPTDFRVNEAHITAETASEKAADNFLYNGSASGRAVFSPYCPSDAARLYVRSEDGTYVRAFPEADRVGWKGLTEEQRSDIFGSEEKYIYFPAGSTVPMIFKTNKDRFELSEVPADTAEKKYVLDEEGTRRRNCMLNSDEIRLLNEEKRRHEIDVDLYDMNRVREMQKSIYGGNFEDIGSEEYRTFTQNVVKAFADSPKKEQMTYPEPCSDLTKDELAALTLLSFGNPDVNGYKHRGVIPESSAGSEFQMAVNDMYIQRANLATSSYMRSAFDARIALAPALKKYAESGDPGSLAETIAKGMRTLSIFCSNTGNLDVKFMTELIPAKMVSDLLDRKPELLDAAMEYAVLHGIDTFADDLKRCRLSATVYDNAQDYLNAERRLLAYNAGELTDDKGMTVSVRDEERRELELKRRKYNFLNQSAKSHFYATTETILKIYEKELPKRIMEVAKIGGDQNAVADEERFIALSQPTSSVFQSLFTTKNGMKAFEAILETVADPDDFYEVNRALKQYGLIPGADKLDPYGYNMSITKSMQAFYMTDVPEPGFDFEKAADKCLETLGKYAEKNVGEPTEKSGELTEKNSKLTEKFSELTEKFNERLDELTEKYSGLLTELGLNMNDIRSLAFANGVTIEQYLSAAAGENMNAEANAPTKEEPENKEPTLGDFEKLLKDDSIRTLSPEKMCTTLKQLNSFASKHSGDIYAAYQSGELLAKLCLHIHEYENGHKDFVTGKARYVRSQDFLDARQHILNGREAAAKMKTESAVAIPKSASKRMNEITTNVINQRRILSIAADFASDCNKARSNISAVFGAEAVISPDAKLKDESDVRRLSEIIKPEAKFAVPEGFAPEQVTALVLLNQITPANLAKNTVEPECTHSRNACISEVVNHSVEDAIVDRTGLFNMAKDAINDVRIGVKKALEDYTVRKDPSALGGIIANALPAFVNSPVTAASGVSPKLAASMHINTAILDMLEAHGDIMDAAKKNGLTENTLDLVRSQRSICRFYDKRNAAVAEIFSANVPRGADLRLKLADYFAGEMANSMIRSHEKDTSKLNEAFSVAEMKKVAEGKLTTDEANINIATYARENMVSYEGRPEYKLFGKYPEAIRQSLFRNKKFNSFCEALSGVDNPADILSDEKDMNKFVDSLNKEILKEQPLRKLDANIIKEPMNIHAPGEIRVL